MANKRITQLDPFVGNPDNSDLFLMVRNATLSTNRVTYANVVSSINISLNSVFNTVQANSASWEESVFITEMGLASAGWNSSYSNVVANSAGWNANRTKMYASSASWDSVYSNSNALTAGWENTRTKVAASSASWDSAYSNVNLNSAGWEATEVKMYASSASWDSVYSSSRALTAGWENTRTKVAASSASWDAVYTTVNTNSAAISLALAPGGGTVLHSLVLGSTTQQISTVPTGTISLTPVSAIAVNINGTNYRFLAYA